MSQNVRHRLTSLDEWLVSSPSSTLVSPPVLCLSAIFSVVTIVILIRTRQGQLKMEDRCEHSDFHWRKVHRLAACLLSATVFLACVIGLWAGFFVPAIRSLVLVPRSEILKVFQVHRPVPVPSKGSGGCTITLMDDHVFGNSYGQPFIGKSISTMANSSYDVKDRRPPFRTVKFAPPSESDDSDQSYAGSYTPPRCKFNAVTMNLTVTSKGRQFDRLAMMYLGDIEVFRTSTAEPTQEGIIWTYLKDMSQFDVLWRSNQTLIFDLGNLINDIYTGSFNTTLTVSFWTREDAKKTPDLILPISAGLNIVSDPDTLSVPKGRAISVQSLPSDTERAIVSIAACGQIGEEFWYTNVPSSHTQTFPNTTGLLGGASPFREIQLLIDGMLAGVVWPFPVIFTGGIAPGLWRPIVGIDAFDIRESEIDVSPFIPLLTDGQSHTFEIMVLGLDDDGNRIMSLTEKIGSYWVMTGKLLVYLGDTDAPTDHAPPTVTVHRAEFRFESDVSKNRSEDGNSTLRYYVFADRSLSVSSSYANWTQVLAFRNVGSLVDRGYTQSNVQISSGVSKATYGSGEEHVQKFAYPINVETTFGAFPEGGISIDASIAYGLTLAAAAGGSQDRLVLPDVFGKGISAVPSLQPHLRDPIRWPLQTRLDGTAKYSSSPNASYSFGTTHQSFSALESGGKDYFRRVTAVNGTIRYDSQLPPSQGLPREHVKRSNEPHDPAAGRNSVRALIGRGPGRPHGLLPP